MPDDARSDDQLIEAAHRAVEALRFVPRSPEAAPAEYARRCKVADAALTALGKRLYQLREQCQAAEDALAHAQSLAAPVVSGAMELDSFLRHWP